MKYIIFNYVVAASVILIITGQSLFDEVAVSTCKKQSCTGICNVISDGNINTNWTPKYETENSSTISIKINSNRKVNAIVIFACGRNDCGTSSFTGPCQTDVLQILQYVKLSQSNYKRVLSRVITNEGFLGYLLDITPTDNINLSLYDDTNECYFVYNIFVSFLPEIYATRHLTLSEDIGKIICSSSPQTYNCSRLYDGDYNNIWQRNENDTEQFVRFIFNRGMHLSWMGVSLQANTCNTRTLTVTYQTEGYQPLTLNHRGGNAGNVALTVPKDYADYLVYPLPTANFAIKNITFRFDCGSQSMIDILEMELYGRDYIYPTEAETSSSTMESSTASSSTSTSSTTTSSAATSSRTTSSEASSSTSTSSISPSSTSTSSTTTSSAATSSTRTSSTTTSSAVTTSTSSKTTSSAATSSTTTSSTATGSTTTSSIPIGSTTTSSATPGSTTTKSTTTSSTNIGSTKETFSTTSSSQGVDTTVTSTEQKQDTGLPSTATTVTLIDKLEPTSVSSLPDQSTSQTFEQVSLTSTASIKTETSTTGASLSTKGTASSQASKDSSVASVGSSITANTKTTESAITDFSSDINSVSQTTATDSPSTTTAIFNNDLSTSALTTISEKTTTNLAPEITTTIASTTEATTTEATTSATASNEATTTSSEKSSTDVSVSSTSISSSIISTPDITTLDMSTTDITTPDILITDTSSSDIQTPDYISDISTTDNIIKSDVSTSDITISDSSIIGNITSTNDILISDISTSDLTTSDISNIDITASTDITTSDILTTDKISSDISTTDISRSEVSTHITSTDIKSTSITTLDMLTTDIIHSDISTTDLNILANDITTRDILTNGIINSDISTTDIIRSEISTDITTSDILTTDIIHSDTSTSDFKSNILRNDITRSDISTTSESTDTTKSDNSTNDINTSEISLLSSLNIDLSTGTTEVSDRTTAGTKVTTTDALTPTGTGVPTTTTTDVTTVGTDIPITSDMRPVAGVVESFFKATSESFVQEYTNTSSSIYKAKSTEYYGYLTEAYMGVSTSNVNKEFIGIENIVFTPGSIDTTYTVNFADQIPVSTDNNVRNAIVNSITDTFAKNNITVDPNSFKFVDKNPTTAPPTIGTETVLLAGILGAVVTLLVVALAITVVVVRMCMKGQRQRHESEQEQDEMRFHRSSLDIINNNNISLNFPQSYNFPSFMTSSFRGQPGRPQPARPPPYDRHDSSGALFDFPKPMSNISTNEQRYDDESSISGHAVHSHHRQREKTKRNQRERRDSDNASSLGGYVPKRTDIPTLPPSRNIYDQGLQEQTSRHEHRRLSQNQRSYREQVSVDRHHSQYINRNVCSSNVNQRRNTPIEVHTDQDPNWIMPNNQNSNTQDDYMEYTHYYQPPEQYRRHRLPRSDSRDVSELLSEYVADYERQGPVPRSSRGGTDTGIHNGNDIMFRGADGNLHRRHGSSEQGRLRLHRTTSYESEQSRMNEHSNEGYDDDALTPYYMAEEVESTGFFGRISKSLTTRTKPNGDGEQIHRRPPSYMEKNRQSIKQQSNA